jgi:hypothetical protein
MRQPKGHSERSSITRAVNAAAEKPVADPTVTAGSSDAVAAALPPDEFGRWLAAQSPRLPPDFELDI